MADDSSLPDLQVIGAHESTVDDHALRAAAADLGLALPPSYREFAQRYGYGLTCGLFIVYLPLAAPECDTLVERSRELSEEIRTAVDGGWMRYEPDGGREVALRLVPFGYSENANILAWDPADETGDGEYQIYVIGSRKSGMRRAAPDIGTFLRRAAEPNVGGMLGRAEFTLSATFEPWPVPSTDHDA